MGKWWKAEKTNDRWLLLLDSVEWPTWIRTVVVVDARCGQSTDIQTERHYEARSPLDDDNKTW